MRRMPVVLSCFLCKVETEPAIEKQLIGWQVVQIVRGGRGSREKFNSMPDEMGLFGKFG